ncbi:RNA polymerase sigma factor [Luethyella okanaganae]|uniref:RNA polymerase sigma factor n=1 Tax=Luethyella okanaganae TaxID=69372 RepID=A0ABW1VH47_9MICO
MPTDIDEPCELNDDDTILCAVRAGDLSAYGELWRRHRAASLTLARACWPSAPEDLVSEGFTAVLAAIRAGVGPRYGFRTYLFAVLRRLAASWARARRETTIDFADELPAPGDSGCDPEEHAIVADAFQRLPDRWQLVLRLSVVDGLSPSLIGERLDMTENAVAALTFRAKDGLRRSWVRAQLPERPGSPEHVWAMDHIVPHVRSRLRPLEARRLRRHVDACASCASALSTAAKLWHWVAAPIPSLRLRAPRTPRASHRSELLLGDESADPERGVGIDADHDLRERWRLDDRWLIQLLEPDIGPRAVATQ